MRRHHPSPSGTIAFGIQYPADSWAASVALLLVFNTLPDHQKTDDLEMFEQAFSNLSSADQNYLLTVYQDDLFINE